LTGDEDNTMSDVFTFNDGNEKITLRYDLRSPLSRFVAQNYRELPFPYKRYAIGNVWRNEKPDTGKSRYREFSQADCDIIGNVNSSQADAEICNIDSNQRLIYLGQKITKLSENYFNNKRKRELMNELFKLVQIENSKRQKLSLKQKKNIQKQEDLLKKEKIDASGAVTKGANLSDVQASEILNFLKIKNIKDLKSTLKNSLSVEGIKETEGLLEIMSIFHNL
jgi:histidyl-tRNA synthetase